MSKEQTDLLPCPFCGSHAETWQPDERSQAIEAGCVDEFDTCAIRPLAWGFDRAEAIAAWNRRASPSPAGGVQGVGDLDLRTLVPGFRLDWSGLRNRLDEAFAKFEKLDTYEMRAAHLDELARQFEDAVTAALSSQAQTTGGVE